MGWLVCWSAGAGTIESNGCYVYAPPLLPLLAGYCCSPLSLSLFLSLLRALYNGYRAALKQGPERSSAELHGDRIYGCCSHSGNSPPGLFELASASKQASMEVVLVPEWDDGRTDGGPRRGGLEVACCGPAAGWGRRFWARDQGDQRWGVLVLDASGREALSGPLALALPAVDGPSFRARREGQTRQVIGVVRARGRASQRACL